MIKKFIYLLIINVFLTVFGHAPNKIVGLVQVRNEEHIIEQCLACLAHFVDAIIILNDASHDKTLNIINFLAQQSLHKIKKIISNQFSMWQKGFESANRQKLLDAGRAIGGTHFVLIDADEVITANCLQESMLRKQILSLQPGDRLDLTWIQLWRSPYQYRNDKSMWSDQWASAIFCDDRAARYKKYHLHGSRLPSPLLGKIYTLPAYEYGIMHFQFVNWQNLLIKQAWYRCLERIRLPNKSVDEINKRYAPSKSEINLKTVPTPNQWFDGYPAFDPMIYTKTVLWRKQQVREWFVKYGKNYFKQLDIWDINWNT